MFGGAFRGVLVVFVVVTSTKLASLFMLLFVDVFIFVVLVCACLLCFRVIKYTIYVLDFMQWWHQGTLAG